MKARRVWWLFCLCLMACGRFCGGERVAEVVALSGDVQRDFASSVGSWGSIGVGDGFAIGDGLRTGSQSMASLKLYPEGTALVDPNTVLRFLDRAPGDAREGITLEEGAIEIDTGQLELDVHTARAIAHVSQGTRLRVRAQGSADPHFDVLVGRIAVEQDGKTENVSADGRAASKAAAEPDASAPEPEVEHSADPGGPPTRADFALAGPESATVHATSLPVDLSIALPACPEGQAALEVIGQNGRRPQTAAGAGANVLVRLGAGANRLRFRCGKTSSDEGVLRVQRDPATMELPKTVPHVAVEADGRKYTVRYQNVLPAVALSWPKAPTARSYTLVVKRRGRDESFSLRQPKYELASGELGEGDHEFSFATDDGQRSPVGMMRIVFDNTARSAYLSSPPEGASAAGGEVTVAGAALLRSEVSVNGVRVDLDGQGRFKLDVPFKSGQSSVVVRVSHPVTGVHYYLRRMR